MKGSPFGRSLRVLALCVGFYGLGLLVAGALFWLPWAQMRYEHGPGITGLLCAAAGIYVLFGMLPRPSRFNAPGQALTPTQHHRLQTLIDNIADRAGQPRAHDVYVVPNAMAFTTIQRKWFGLVRRRVIGVGLPLLASLSHDELGSVIAHELGHHAGGDLSIAPWVVTTRRAMIATLDNLDGSALWLHLPFVLYARVFLRLTYQASRQRGAAADALAARIVGRAHTASALTRVHEVGPRWSVYWEQEVVPLLERGRIVPLLEGFRIFCREADASPPLAQAFQEARNRGTSEHDTHPSLAERLAELGTSPVATRDSASSSLDLLDDVVDAERQALAAVLTPDSLTKLAPLAWMEVTEALWVPSWRRDLLPFDAALSGLDLRDLPQVIANASEWSGRLRRGIAMRSPEAERKRLIATLATWASLRLVERHGFTPDLAPGSPVRLVRGGLTVLPHQIVHDLASGALDAAAFGVLIAELGPPPEQAVQGP